MVSVTGYFNIIIDFHFTGKAGMILFDNYPR